MILKRRSLLWHFEEEVNSVAFWKGGHFCNILKRRSILQHFEEEVTSVAFWRGGHFCKMFSFYTRICSTWRWSNEWPKFMRCECQDWTVNDRLTHWDAIAQIKHMILKTQNKILHISQLQYYIYIHFILSFVCHVFNAWGPSVRPKRVQVLMGLIKFVVAKDRCFSLPYHKGINYTKKNRLYQQCV